MRILVVDDHTMFREGVLDYLRKELFVSEAIGAESVEDAKNATIAEEPTLVVTDLSLPEKSGKELISWLRDTHPGVAVLVMTMHDELSSLRAAIELGARGYITKSSGYYELVQAIHRVTRGDYYLDQVMLTKLLHQIGRAEIAGPSISPVEDLTTREREIFELLLTEESAAAIGEKLFISEKTVENHRTSIYRKLGVHDRLSLFRFAREQGLLE